MVTHKSLLCSILTEKFGDREEFCLKEVYTEAENALLKKAPTNTRIQSTIRDTMQKLRDDGVIVFVKGRRGTYRWGKKGQHETPSSSDSDEDMEGRHETPPSSDSDEDMESWPDVDEGYEGDIEAGGISKEMMWKMCQGQYKLIETLKEENESLTKEVDELKKKESERLLMVALAREVAQKALVSSSSDEDEKPLESTWSNEAVIDIDESSLRFRRRRQEKKVEFDETVEEKVYEIDGTMRPHKRWKKEPVVKMSPNMGHW